jgi:hypothetical protein
LKSGKKPEETKKLVSAGSLLDFFFNPEDDGDMIFRKVKFSPNFTALQPR